MKTRYLLYILLIIFSAACSDFIELDEDNPNAFKDAPEDLMFVGPQLANILVAEGELARMAGIFSNQFTGSDRQYISLNGYNVTAGDFDNAWGTLYAEGVAQCRIIKEKATTTKNDGIKGVTQIVEASLVGIATSLWGDVPYAQVGDVAQYPQPAYDKQSDVYAALQTLLDEAITNVGTSVGSDFSNATIDESVAADMKWSEVANTLKARFYLHTGNYAAALAAAQSGISNGGDWLVDHSGGYVDGKFNIMYSFMDWHRGGYMTAADAYLPTILDPTSASYKGNAKTDETARYNFYFLKGDDASYSETYDPNYSNGIFSVNAPYTLASYVENQLIIAECEARLSNFNNALAALNNVRASNVVTYASSTYDALVQADFQASGLYDNGGTEQENLLREILREKYISLFGQIEVFNDLRRTDNLIQVPLKEGKDKLPERFVYPQSEINSNSNVPQIQDIYVPTEVNQ